MPTNRQEWASAKETAKLAGVKVSSLPAGLGLALDNFDQVCLRHPTEPVSDKGVKEIQAAYARVEQVKNRLTPLLSGMNQFNTDPISQARWALYSKACALAGKCMQRMSAAAYSNRLPTILAEERERREIKRREHTAMMIRTGGHGRTRM